ncbi:hypothetical protein YC2023_102752 [Brassica napus]
MGVTVTAEWTGGGNFRTLFPNDGIVARWFSLVPSDGLGGVFGSCRSRSIKV